MSPEKKKVLVIDDHEEALDLVDVTLRGTEFEVIKALGGREGIQIARVIKPDLILLDIMMPNFDGFMTSKAIKRNPATRDIPIIFLTAKKTKEDLYESVKAGGLDYIVKPFSPNDLLTRVRKTLGYKGIKYASRRHEKEKKTVTEELQPEVQKPKLQKQLPVSFKRFGDVMVFYSSLVSIVMDNCHIYRDAFAHVVSDGIFKMVMDMGEIHKIDGAGLGLLISVNESLRSYGGELHLTFPGKEVNNRFSFIKLNDLFLTYSTIEEAIESFKQPDREQQNPLDLDELNICMSCTFANSPGSRYCSLCGANLVLGKGEKIFEILGRSISRKVMLETQTKSIQKMNQNRNIEAEKYKIPLEFDVELFENELKIIYKSTHTNTENFEKNEQIAIHAPFLGGKMLPVQRGMQLRLGNTKTGTYSMFETKIDSINIKKGIIFVHYTEDAKILHSQKNFSVAPKLPVPISMTVPTFQYAGKILKGKIFELSRIRMVVFSEENIPVNQCLAAHFNLPEGQEISSPLVIAQKGRQRYMYDIEFKVVDGKESSKITQYMYKRQIEMVKQ